MYNFYRAWFGTEQTCPRLETLSPPDTLIRVGNDGEHQFVAHRGILAAHSGYLKALLSNSNSGNSTLSSDGNSVISSISVSSIGGEAFAPLLNYMYTGHLDVNLDNIYSVLLATHLLHMPGALEQCRAALLRLRTPPAIPVQQTGQGNVLRPVPNRLVGPPLCWPQTSLYGPGPIISRLPSLHLPQTIIPPLLQDNPGSSLSYSTRERSLSPKSSPSRPRRSESRSRSRSRSLTPVIPQVQLTPQFSKNSLNLSSKRKTPDESQLKSSSSSEISEKISVTNVEHISQQLRRARTNAEQESNSSGSVVYDVACCDGPVRFHRVLNENYSAPSTGTAIRPRNCLETDDTTSGENDENGRPEDLTHESTVDCGVSGNYTCNYCQHTFKSQYCYRKHARRHLLPTEAESSSRNHQQRHQLPSQQQQQQPPQQPQQQQQQQHHHHQQQQNNQDKRRREVRLLDLNVQYYPCKICGSKFPSYYFVHKHRKMCHSNITDETTRDSNNLQNDEEIIVNSSEPSESSGKKLVD
ncbi:protein kinase 4 [Leptopilina heterotoma]|uniref:protein kinase 4 n=1 Tax=Leptopilina heterotoma TaxID=63436 RepID=UPI001CA9BD0C|nr:protein kinase 4 [Leptopilina heterotoma]XP_043472224.1 protein kinase 4 [Leptopilina heterotoma]